ncbi:MAG: hypothetical protein WCG93_13495 [Paludibacter sp.]
MKRNGLLYCLILFLLPISISCSTKESEEPTPKSDIWDIDQDGIPKFVKTNYIELSKIYRISKFRSSEGHDYSDATEHCRSMKHYFVPREDVDWTTVKIYSPVTGYFTRVEQEWAGTKYEIASDDYPAFRFSVFHVNPSLQRNINDKVVAGELLGTHVGRETNSDISVIVNDPTRQGRMVSYFDVITDSVFNQYVTLGISSRSDLIISKAKRDANPLSCSGELFISSDTIQNWVVLK